MTGANTGAVGVGEIGYTMPESYERYFSVSTSELHVGGGMSDENISLRNGHTVHVGGPDISILYDHYVGDTLRRFEAGEPPIATIGDMVPVLRVMNAAVQSAHEGETITIE
jgi:hypothetical protein